jgi:hypothetical protein
MSDDAVPFDALLDLDLRHDELLRQLDDLDRRVQQVLAEYLPANDASHQPFDASETVSIEPPAAAA